VQLAEENVLGVAQAAHGVDEALGGDDQRGEAHEPERSRCRGRVAASRRGSSGRRAPKRSHLGQVGGRWAGRYSG
jgi:hypothetical protein